MANSNLAHDEQLLKHLDHTLKEIGDQHKLMHDLATSIQDKLYLVNGALSESWAKTINLFVVTEKLRKSRREQEV